MEKHFLADKMEGTPTFTPEPWYNPDGDCIIYQLADEAVVAERVDELLTVYNSAIDDRPIGFQIKGVQAILNKFGYDALTIDSRTDVSGNSVKSVSIVALLLAAYEEGPRTFKRRKGYAIAMDCPVRSRTIPADQLQSA